MILVDTSVWVDLLRDRTGTRKKVLRRAIGRHEVALTRFHQLELLQGARDEPEWELLEDYLASQRYLEMHDESWARAARLYFDLRRAGLTVRSPIDCCIATVALASDVLLLHRDRDFEVISRVSSLRQRRLEW